LLAALYEDDIRGIYNRGALTQYSTALRSSAVHLPHDAIVPGAIAAGDIPAVLAALPSIPVHFRDPIDGMNRPLSSNRLNELRECLERQVGGVTVTYSGQGTDYTTTAQWLRKCANAN
jgi:hypothetical protein